MHRTGVGHWPRRSWPLAASTWAILPRRYGPCAASVCAMHRTGAGQVPRRSWPLAASTWAMCRVGMGHVPHDAGGAAAGGGHGRERPSREPQVQSPIVSPFHRLDHGRHGPGAPSRLPRLPCRTPDPGPSTPDDHGCLCRWRRGLRWKPRAAVASPRSPVRHGAHPAKVENQRARAKGHTPQRGQAERPLATATGAVPIRMGRRQRTPTGRRSAVLHGGPSGGLRAGGFMPSGAQPRVGLHWLRRVLDRGTALPGTEAGQRRGMGRWPWAALVPARRVRRPDRLARLTDLTEWFCRTPTRPRFAC